MLSERQAPVEPLFLISRNPKTRLRRAATKAADTDKAVRCARSTCQSVGSPFRCALWMQVTSPWSDWALAGASMDRKDPLANTPAFSLLTHSYLSMFAVQKTFPAGDLTVESSESEWAHKAQV